MTNCCSNNKKFVQRFIEVKTLKYRIFWNPASPTDRSPLCKKLFNLRPPKMALQSRCNFVTTFFVFVFCFFFVCFCFVLFCFIFVLFYFFSLINEKQTFLENWQIQDDCFMNESIFHWKMRLHADHHIMWAYVGATSSLESARALFSRTSWSEAPCDPGY